MGTRDKIIYSLIVIIIILSIFGIKFQKEFVETIETEAPSLNPEDVDNFISRHGEGIAQNINTVCEELQISTQKSITDLKTLVQTNVIPVEKTSVTKKEKWGSTI